MAAPADAPQPIQISQPAGHPEGARLEVSSVFAARYTRIRALVTDATILDHHVALAVLFDEASRQPDEEVVDFARHLSAVDRHIRDNPGTRLVSINSACVKIAKVTGSGLFAIDSTVQWHAAHLLLPCTSVVTAGISGAYGDEPVVTPYPKESGYTVTEKVLNNNTTPYLLAPTNLDGVDAALHGFLAAQGGVVMIGDKPISSFFRAAIRKDPARDGISSAKHLATKAAGFVSVQRGFKSLGLC
jgi:hypothetical protein